MPLQVRQTAKQIAINTARQAAREGSEFLKSGREQIAPFPTSSEKPKDVQNGQQQQAAGEQTNVAKLREHSQFMNTYRNELEQIRKEKLFKDLQKRIAEGEEVSLADYINELSIEELQVLKAQMEAVTVRKAAAVSQQPKGVPQIISKQARGMLGAFKKRNQQHVETQKMPSN